MACWSIGWRITNKGDGPLSILALRLPHGLFRSAEETFEPALDLAPGQSGEFQTSVHCDESAGPVTENAFVIFSVIWLGEAWRIFVRLRVVVNAEGRPVTATEAITSHKVGFSGLAS